MDALPSSPPLAPAPPPPPVLQPQSVLPWFGIFFCPAQLRAPVDPCSSAEPVSCGLCPAWEPDDAGWSRSGCLVFRWPWAVGLPKLWELEALGWPWRASRLSLAQAPVVEARCGVVCGCLCPPQKQSCLLPGHSLDKGRVGHTVSSYPSSECLINTCPTLAVALGSCWDLGPCWLQPVWPAHCCWHCMPRPVEPGPAPRLGIGLCVVAGLGLTGRFACIALFPACWYPPCLSSGPFVFCPQCPQPA